jgi:nicotinamidase-related amidase
MFLVVDVQNDFISGTLNISHCSARQNGAEVRLKVKRLRVSEKHFGARMCFFTALYCCTGTFCL